MSQAYAQEAQSAGPVTSLSGQDKSSAIRAVSGAHAGKANATGPIVKDIRSRNVLQSQVDRGMRIVGQGQSNGGVRGALPCSGTLAVDCTGSDLDNAANSTAGLFKIADNFLPVTETLSEVCWRGAYLGTGPFVDNFTITIYSDDDFNGIPDTVVATRVQGANLTLNGPGATGNLIAGQADEQEWHASFPAITLVPGQCFFIEIVNDLVDGQAFFWGDGDATSLLNDGQSFADDTPGSPYSSLDSAAGDRNYCMDVILSQPLNGCFPALPDEICQNEFGGGCQLTDATADNAFLSNRVDQSVADDFRTTGPGSISTMCWWGIADGPDEVNNFRIRFLANDNGAPGTVLATYNAGDMTISRGWSGAQVAAINEREYSATFNTPFNVDGDTCYWVEISNDIAADWFWVAGVAGNVTSSIDLEGDGTYVFGDEAAQDMAFCVDFSTASSESCLAVAPNQTCDSAQPLTIGAPPVTGFNLRVPAQGIPPANDAFFGLAPTVWYRVVGNGTNLTVSTCDTDTGFDSIVAVYCNACGNLTAVAQNDDTVGCGSGDSADLASQVSFCAANGTTYFIAVRGFAAAEGVFQINVTSAAGACTPASCTHCQVSTAGTSAEAGEPCGATTDVNATCATSMNLALGAAGVSGTLYTFLGGANFDTPTRDIDGYRFSLPNNSNIAVVINAEFPFFAQLRRLNVAGDCAATTFVTNMTGNACTPVTTNVTLTAGDYAIQITPNGFSGLDCGNNNNDYKMTVNVVSFVEPANNLCANATPITVGAPPVTGTTLGATEDPLARACGFTTNTGASVWYSVVGDGSTFTVDLCHAGTNFDTQVAVFCGDCTNLNCVVQNDDGAPATCNGLASQVAWETSAGTTYRIAVYGFGAQSGNFQIAVNSDNSQCGVAQACAACDLAVPGGSTTSPEPCGTVFGGAFPASMCPAAAAQQDILTTFGTFVGSFHTGDADLVRITFAGTAGQNNIQVTLRSEVPLNVLPVVQTCPNVFGYTVGGAPPPQITVPACGTGGFVFTFPAGGVAGNQHALLVRGLGGNNIACPGGTGNNYTISVERVGFVSLPNQFGACCMDDGTCAANFQLECSQAGGVFQGEGTACETVVCPAPTGACCASDGTCSIMSQAACDGLRGGSAYQGNCIPCAQVVCVASTGACCNTDGSCTEVSETDCTTAGGTFEGGGTTCANTDCPQPTGACCLDRCTCVQLTESECSEQGGAFSGAGTACETAEQCFLNPACPCDVNGFDGLDSQDFFDFLNLFFSADPGADVNCFDGVDSQDYFDFLNCFFEPPAGCAG